MKIGSHKVGRNHKTFIVAEMSGNHNGNFERAIEIINAAKRSGADAVKLQTYTPDSITLHCSAPDFRVSNGSPWESHESLWDLYEKAHTPWEWHAKLFEHEKKINLEVFSSPFDIHAVDFLEGLNPPIYKIASPEITHIPLLERVAKTGKPVIISSGVATLNDIELAIQTLKQSGCKDIILLKCSSAYPTPEEECNLRTLQDFENRFGVLPGLSDHTIGSMAALTSVALGAVLVEKHFTLDDGEEGVDSFFSAGEIQFKNMVDDIRRVERIIGEISYETTPSVVPSLTGRRSIYVSASIKKGHPITENNIRVVRPSFGLHPKHYQEVLGSYASKDLSLGDRLDWSMLTKDIGKIK